MNTELWQRAKPIFEEALDLPRERRDPFLESSCGGDEGLREAVSSLLEVDLGDEPILGSDAAAADLHLALDEVKDGRWLGRSLGSYRIVDKLGQGGMGSVYLAERADDAYQKKVAVKLLPFWWSNAENLRRFRQERQILALLEHPNIARLLDGGTTEDGLPFLVMEYVEGETLTDFCDARRLTARQRLELMLVVCDAVSYAHQNLIVHRDLKPPNILVTQSGVPKLLDFGIAKLLDASSSGQTLTQARLLTPEYASPEQIAGRVMTTASDVYTLGVLLYELLVGRRPFAWGELDWRRIEEDVTTRLPLLPSAAVLGAEAGPAARASPLGAVSGDPFDPETVAQKRWSRPRALSRQLSGDLDNVILKSLRSNPEKRYRSVADLAEDLRRFLAGRPVEARPAGYLDRFVKLVRRHTLASTLVAAVAVLVVSFLVLTTLQSKRIAQERDFARREQARAEQVSRLLIDAFESADPSRSRGEDITAKEILKNGARRISRELAHAPDLKAEMLLTIGRVYTRLGLYATARPLLQRSLEMRRELFGEEHLEVAESLHEWADLLHFSGEFDEAEAAVRQALSIRRGADPAKSAESLHLLAEVRRNQDERDEAIRLHEEALALQRIDPGTEHPDYVRGLTLLARSVRLRGERERAEELYRQALALQQELRPGDDPLSAEILNALSRLHTLRQDLEAAAELARQGLEMNRRLYDAEHPMIASSLSTLANIETDRGRYGAAEDLYREVLELHRKLLGPEHPRVAGALYNLGLLHQYELEDPAGAEPLYREAIEIFIASVGADHNNLAFFLVGLGGTLNDLERPGEAEAMLRRALDIFSRRSKTGASGRNASMAKSELGGALLALGRREEAETLLREGHPVLVDTLGAGHAMTLRATRRLAGLYRATGRGALADELEAAAGSEDG